MYPNVAAQKRLRPILLTTATTNWMADTALLGGDPMWNLDGSSDYVRTAFQHLPDTWSCPGPLLNLLQGEV